MTGSGKTGLGVAVIEEAALDGVPVIVIDPKGDLTNLALTFPGLRAGDFQPWVNEDDAGARARTCRRLRADQAERWQKGLAEWGEDGTRMQRLRDAAEFTIYTPGSTAGVPVSVLTSFQKPDDRTTPNSFANGRRRRCRACLRWPASRSSRSRAASTSCSRRSCWRRGRRARVRIWRC